MRCLILTWVLVLMLAGCSSEPAEHDISFQESFNTATGETLWTAAGPAVDDGAICAEASRVGAVRFETPEGESLSEADVSALNEGSEPFSYVASGDMACADGSGMFVMSTTNDVTNPEAFEMTSTWTIQGAEGYEDVTGEGTVDDMSFEGDPPIITGTNTGVILSP